MLVPKEFITSCIDIALSRGFHAIVQVNESYQIGQVYKSLTREMLREVRSEASISITLELDGKKAAQSSSFTKNLSPEKLVDGVIELLKYATPDSAESIPEITDSLVAESTKFSQWAISDWVEKTYNLAYKALSTNSDNYEIETLEISASVATRIFANSFGAFKSHTTSGSSIIFEYTGKLGEVSEVDYFARSEPYLLEWDSTWEWECAKKLWDRLHHVPAQFIADTYSVAFEPEIATAVFSEFLGLLSGYSIAEGMSPFTKESLGTAVMPKWATLQSIPHGTGLSVSQYFDGNGITPKPLTLVENGVLTGLFLRKAAALRLGLEPNGQSGPLNIIWSNSEPRSNLIGVKMLFTDLSWLGTIDSSTGNFTLDGSGYQVNPDGTLGGFVKNVGLSGNICDVFARLSGSLNDALTHGAYRVPTIITAPIPLTPTI
jgi:predicted Zn-dependent protease